jgi:hypothetical protein
LHRQGQQCQHGIEIGAAGEGVEIHPGDVMLEESPQPPGCWRGQSTPSGWWATFLRATARKL